MSYRLSTLPYSLKRRLHELAKPYEIMQLQNASQYCMSGFCPRPFRRRFTCEVKLTIEFKNAALKIEGGGAFINSADYVVCERELTLHKLTADHFASEDVDWSKLVLRPTIVTISYCDLSPAFMAKLAATIDGTTNDLTIRNCTGLVVFETLFKAFPNVEILKIVGGFAKTWAIDILKHQKCPLKSLELEGDFKDGDKLFDYEDFKKLVSAQSPRFHVDLNPLDDPTQAIQEMLLQGDCPDLEYDDPEAKSIYVSGSYGGKNSFLYR